MNNPVPHEPDVTKLTIGPIVPADAPAIHALTWRHYQPLLQVMLQSSVSAVRPCCLVARIESRPVGLLLSIACEEYHHDNGRQRLLSLMILPEYRRLGIARRLLQAFEFESRVLRIHSISARYSDRLASASILDTLLPSAGWQIPMAKRLRICGQAGQTHQIFRNQAALTRRLERNGLRIKCWQQGPDEALALAQRCLDEGSVPDWAAPSPWLQQLDPQHSLLLCNADNQVVGWVICEYQAPLSRWHYPVGWVMPPYDTHGWLLGAYADGARRLAEQHGEAALVVIETSTQQGGMWRVLEKHFAPHVTWSDHLMFSERLLD